MATTKEKIEIIKSQLKKLPDQSWGNWDVFNTADRFEDYAGSLRRDGWNGQQPLENLNKILRNTATGQNVQGLQAIVFAKIKNLAETQEGDPFASAGNIGTLYTGAVHEEYIRWVLADYIEKNNKISGGAFKEAVGGTDFATDEAMEAFQAINLDWQKFMPATKLTGAGPSGFTKSWDHLLDLLAGQDVTAGTSEVINNIKNRLKDRNKNAGSGSITAGALAAGMTAEERAVFYKNLPQELLIALERKSGIPSKYRNDIRQKTYNHNKKHTPYGGRIYNIATGMNTFKRHPFSWKFFRDIDSVDKIATKFQICKMIYRKEGAQEVALPLALSNTISKKSTEGNTTDPCGAKYPDTNTNYLVEALNISFKGTTPATAQNDVEVTMTIHLPTVGSLIKRHTKKATKTTPAFEWSVLDLITYVGNTDTESARVTETIYKNQYSELNRSRVILKIGYAEGKITNDWMMDSILQDSPMILDLAVIDHTIEKDEEKPYAKLKITYAGFATKMLNSTMTDVLAGDNLAARLERDRIVNQAIAQNCDNKTVETLINLARDLNRDEVVDLRETFMERLLERGKVFTMDYSPGSFAMKARGVNGKLKITNDFLESWVSFLTQHGDGPKVLKRGQSKNIEDYILGKSTLLKGTLEEFKTKQIYWTTIADLIDVAMDTVFELKLSDGGLRESEGRKANFRDHPIKVIMDYQADYPVSISYFLEWMKTEIVDQDFDYYPLMGFIRHMIQVFVTNFMNKQDADDIPHFPMLTAVESGLGLPMPRGDEMVEKAVATDIFKTGASKGSRRTMQTICCKQNKDRFDIYVKQSLANKRGGKINGSRPKSSNRKWDPACERDYEKELELSGHGFYPIIRNNYDSKINEYINYIYCFSYKSKSELSFSSPSECIKGNIPVIRLSDFRYKEKYKPTTSIGIIATGAKKKKKAVTLEQRDEEEVAKNRIISSSGKKPDKDGNYSLPFQSAVVKSIKFTKKNDDYLREARYSSRNLGLFAQLTSVYSATVTLQGFCSFLFPGQTVYIDSGIGSEALTEGSLANTLGLGGLHVITGVTHKIELKDNSLTGIKTSFDAIFSFNNAAKSFGGKPNKTNEAQKKVCENLYKTLPDPFGKAAANATELTAADMSVIQPKQSAIDTKKEREDRFADPNIQKAYLGIAQRRNPTLDIPDNAKLTYIGDTVTLDGALKDINYVEDPKLPIYKITWKADGKDKQTKITFTGEQKK